MPLAIWIFAFGAFFSSIGNGFTTFYTPIVFVNQIGLTSTEVGLSLGVGAIASLTSASISGWYSDRVGRRGILIASAVISSIGCIVLSLSQDFYGLIIGNLILKTGAGAYYPVYKAMVADLCSANQRQRVFSLIESPSLLGLGLGVIFGGLLLGDSFRWLFIIDCISFVIFALILIVKLPESKQKSTQFVDNISIKAMLNIFKRDATLQLYLILNIGFSFFTNQSKTILPLYLKLFAEETRLSKSDITFYCTLLILIVALIQIPLIRLVNPLGLIRTLRLSAVFWFLGFGWILLIGLTNVVILPGLFLLATATALHLPTNSSFLTKLSPPNMRGTYLMIGSISWALGSLLGSPVGGWFLDLPRPGADGLWLFLTLLALVVIRGLQKLDGITK